METQKSKVFYGWFALIGAFLACGGAAATAIYSFGVLVVPVTTAMDIPVSAFVLNMTIIMAVSVVMSPITGKLIEKRGSRIVAIVGGLIMAAGHVFLSFATTLPMLYAGFVIVGVAAGMAGPIVATSVATKWFNKKRNLAVGIITAANGIAVLLITPALAGIIIDFGLATSFLFLAVIDVVFIALAGGLLIRNSPEAMGQFPDGIDPKTLGDAKAEAEIKKNVGIGLTAKESMRTSVFWIVAIAFGFFSIAQFGTMQTQNAAMQSLGFDAMTAAGVMSIVGLVSAFIRIIYGFLLDKFSLKLTTSIGLVCLVIGLVMLFTFTPDTSIVMLYVAGIFVGLGAGSWLPLASKHVASTFGAKYFPTVFSIVFMVKNISDMVGPMIPSAVFDLTGAFGPAYLGFAIISVLVLIALLLYKKPKKMVELETEALKGEGEENQ